MHTHRARMCITVWLPNEVLTEIIQNALKADQAALCRVCKLLHALALPVLNREVTLRPDNLRLQDLEAFCSSMIESSVRADSVRSLTFRNGESYSVRGEELIVESLKVMRRLEHLCIDDSRRHGGLVARLAGLTFPNLSSCSFMKAHHTSWKFDIVQFLNRHPTIIHLHLWYDAYGEDTHIADGTLLPKLQLYRGPLRLLRFFSTHNLVTVRIFWSARTSSLVEKLAAQTGPNVALDIEFMYDREILGVLVHLSTHMPHLKKLKLRCWDRNSVAADAAKQITAYLPRFDCLAYIAFDHHGPGPNVDLDGKRKVLQSWANASSTLRGCCIDEVAWRKVGDEWEECSRNAFDIEAGFVTE
ncbi:hypothetical protein FB45DRAFT_162507 [Roridomyces roridus]|uniref:F-box domain-containing protein n=1 Tax=Roridomyces roridus TaxID=1738132 RepID=A0AAD7BG53_9AGAR|nr:hypothetical protein FB45DRAFT_162507 [Roridomyces roridus]